MKFSELHYSGYMQSFRLQASLVSGKVSPVDLEILQKIPAEVRLLLSYQI